MADEYTSRTLRVVTAGDTFAVLSEYVESDQIPQEYGGTLAYAPDDGDKDLQPPLPSHSVRWTSPYEVEMRRHVKRVLGDLKGRRGEVLMAPAGAS